jgi:hypothetical protein
MAFRLPPEAARTAGPPEGADAPLNQSREAHRSARPLHSPEGGQSAAVLRPTGPTKGHDQHEPVARVQRGYATGPRRD